MTLTKYTYNKLTWIDLASPTRDEVTKIMQDFNIHPDVAEELLVNTRKPRIDLYDDHIYLILHFPALEHSHHGETLQEVDFIIGREFLITTRYDSIDAIHKFAKVFETNEILHTSPIGTHAGFLFYFLIKKLYRSLEHELEYIESELETIEGSIFSGKERQMVYQLSSKGRDLTDFKKALGYHEEVLESLELAGKEFFGESFIFYLHRVLGEYRRIHHQLSGEQAFFEELRETNNSLLTTKQNEVMKTLTIMAFVTLPLSLIVGIFGMNLNGAPLSANPYGFWIIIAIMLSLFIVMLGFFKYRKWL